MKARLPFLIFPYNFQKEQSQEKKENREWGLGGECKKKRKENAGLKHGCFVVLNYSWKRRNYVVKLMKFVFIELYRNLS